MYDTSLTLPVIAVPLSAVGGFVVVAAVDAYPKSSQSAVACCL